MHFSRPVLKSIIEKQKLVSGFRDLDKQLTANGIDLRLAALVEIIDGGKLAVEKSDNKMPKLGKAFVLKGYEMRLAEYGLQDIQSVDEKFAVKLNPLRPYFAVTCEEVNIPSNIMCHIESRTTLFRLTQSGLFTTVGEAGYRGFLTFMLLPFLGSEIELGSRFSQLVFTELKGEGHYEQQKESNYQGGKLF